MKVVGIELTHEDIVRIASALGAMSISMLEKATSENDFREGLALGVLHMKLVKAIEKMTECARESSDNEGREVFKGESN